MHNITDYELAFLSKIAYNDSIDSTSLLPGWQILSSSARKVGYQGHALRKGKEIVVAHRGTNEFQDIFTDIIIYLGRVPAQLPFAAKFLLDISLANELTDDDYSKEIPLELELPPGVRSF